MFVSSGYSLYGKRFGGTNLLKKQLETVAQGRQPGLTYYI